MAKKRIYVGRENVKKIAQAFNVKENAVYCALRWEQEENPLHKKIRLVAIKEYKGVILEQ